MRRLKEGFYTIMKLSNAVRDKGQTVKDQLIQFVQTNKIEKPKTEAILQIGSKQGVDVDDIRIEVEMDTSAKEEVKADQPIAPVHAPGKQRAKQKGKKAAVPSFKKKLQLTVGKDTGVEDEATELPLSLQ